MKKSTIKRAAALAVAGMMTATALAGCGGSSSSGSSKMIQKMQQATQKTVKFTILTLSLSRTRIGRLLLRSTRTKQVLR